KAVAMSVNTVAVRTLHDLGISNFRDRLGNALELSYFDSRQRFPANLTLALGSGELTPLELTRIYAVLLNKVGTIRPSLIRSIKDKDGTTLWESTPSGSSNILSETACAEAIDLMTSVVDPDDEGTAGWIGQQRLKNPKFLPFPVAGKSGTVQTVKE